MKQITAREIIIEKARMKVEKQLFGHYLLAGTGESEAFWEDIKLLAKHKTPKHFTDWFDDEE